MKLKRGSISKLSDNQLVWLYVDTRKHEYLSELYLRYLPQVYGVCLYRSADAGQAEAAVVDIFEAMPDKLAAEAADCADFPQWLYRTVVAHLRHRNGETETDTCKPKVLGAEAAAVVDLLLKEDKGPIDKLLYAPAATLSRSQKICLQLFFVGKMSFADIADKSGVLISDVRGHIISGLENLAAAVNPADEKAVTDETH